jgi:hypothetical protein
MYGFLHAFQDQRYIFTFPISVQIVNDDNFLMNAAQQ